MDYPTQVKIPIAWGDMDAFQHVNNVIYFRYFESVRIQYLEELGLMNLMKTKGLGPILANTSCQFIKPLTYPDTITVSTKVKSVGNTSFVLEFMITSEKIGLAAKGEGVIVMFDYRNNKTVRIPDDIRGKL